jgi:hypothetical protein
MKKIVVFAVFMAFLLVVGCETKSYTVLIKNDSSKTVSYIYNEATDWLSPGDSKTYYEVKPYTQPPVNYVDEDGEKSIKIIFNTVTGSYTFVDKDE